MDILHGVVNEALQRVGISVGIARLDVLHSALKDLRPHGLLDELGQIALVGALRAEKVTQGQVGTANLDSTALLRP